MLLKRWENCEKIISLYLHINGVSEKQPNFFKTNLLLVLQLYENCLL